MSYDYTMWNVICNDRIATVTINNPPINLGTIALYEEFYDLTKELSADPDLSVVILKSNNPEFFLAHVDVSYLLTFPTDVTPEKSSELTEYHAACLRLRNMNKVTIAQIEGRAGGGGCELASCCDMRFGVLDKTVLCQMEVPLGIIPGSCGTQTLPKIVGRNRAFEMIMGGEDIDAATAERWGYLNRAFDKDAIGSYVEKLAKRIASFPQLAVQLAKQSLNTAEPLANDGFLEEAYLMVRALQTDEAQTLMHRFIERDGQSREAELRMGEFCGELATP
jgi:enoyl-CoA hydratase/carnithine racemase